jgi:WXXGXW repeat (2 copies)
MSAKLRQLRQTTTWLMPFATAFVACASARAPVASRRILTDAEEARAIAAAKASPIARPRPRSLYPEQSPPPLLDREPPPPLDASNHGDDYLADAPPNESPSQSLVAPVPPPSNYPDSPQHAAPGPDYVWASGYWSWSGRGYLWVTGDWIPGRPGYATYPRHETYSAPAPNERAPMRSGPETSASRPQTQPPPVTHAIPVPNGSTRPGASHRATVRAH